MSELEMFITWLKSKDGAFLDTIDVPKVIVWLEELKAIKSDGFTDNLLENAIDKLEVRRIGN